MAKIAFVQNIAFEHLGVMYISAVLKKHGHDVEMFLVDRSVDEVVSFRPDIVGFSATTGMHRWALGFAARLKERVPCKVLFGGPHATFYPDVINESSVDIVCRGEGEHSMLDIAEKTDRGVDITDTRNCWFKAEGKTIKNEQRPLIENLDELPFPDRDLYLSKYPFLDISRKAFMGHRGCPFSCTFCFNRAFQRLYEGKGKFLRHRSVDNLIAEIKEVRDKYGLKTVYMQDDTFILNRGWVDEFAEKYRKEVGLPFICLIRADLATEEMVKGLSEAGCKNVFFGVETGSDALRNSLLKKRVTGEQIRGAAGLLKKHGIKFRTYNMLGLPGETLEDAFSTVALNAGIGTDYPWCSVFHPFEGTELADYAREKGLLDAPTEDMDHSFFKDSILKSDHKREIVNLQKLFFYAVKFPWAMPAVKRLIRIKPNILFDLAFLSSYGWCYMLSENLTLGEMLSVGIRNVRRFFFGKY